MDEKTAKFLAPIRTICKEVISNDSIDGCVKELIKKITAKDAKFYQFHTFLILLELIKDNPKLEPKKVKQVFTVLDLILNSQEMKLSRRKLSVDFYNYFISLNEVNFYIYLIFSYNFI